MADFSNSRWDAFKYKLNETMQAPEFKRNPSPTLSTMLGGTQFLIPASEKERTLGLKQSDQDTVAIKIINKQNITTGTSRTAGHSGDKNDSTSVDATFSTYSANFGYSLKESDRTIWQLAETQSKQILSAFIALHESIESGLVTWLNTNRSQVVNSLTPRSCAWDATNFIAGISNTDEKRWMQRAKGFMREQYYKGTFDVIADEYLFQEGEFNVQQGQGNSENLAWQSSNLNARVSQDIAINEAYVGQGFMFPQGTIGILPWIPKMNQTGFGDAGMNGGYYTNIPDPFGTGLTFAVHERYVGADNQANSGESQDVNVFVEISVDLAPVKALMSTANASPIFSFGVLQ